MLVRVILATMLLAGGLVAAPLSVARADAETCPPVCDKIPDSAWIRPRAVPLNSTYHWPSLAGIAVPLTGATPRFRFEELCATPEFPQDTRDSAVASRATVVNPQGQWQLQAQVLHWRGDTARGGQNVSSVFNIAAAALRGCQLGSPAQSPSVTVDGANRLAVVISGPVIMHTYLVAHPQSSTISELTLWSSTPPQVPWPVISDDQVLDAMTAPICEAYIASCP
ncbi:ATPase [Mycobacterium sp. MFM001]|uniref:ATPase n=1 Tax=Mycobacterium sp. MFM001 TaxID=2049453 RepID=UPI001EE02E22|nr:ATPase [Mycobacterium sp. MFM001]